MLKVNEINLATLSARSEEKYERNMLHVTALL